MGSGGVATEAWTRIVVRRTVEAGVTSETGPIAGSAIVER
jgi:hypothetical protein